MHVTGISGATGHSEQYVSTSMHTIVVIHKEGYSDSISLGQCDIHAKFKVFCQKKVHIRPLVLSDKCIFLHVSLDFCLILCSDLRLKTTRY